MTANKSVVILLVDKFLVTVNSQSIDYQLSIVKRQPVCCQLSTINCQLSTV
ncbi:MAG: hypothetical protein HC942_10025 [Microcoleus sp. SU_5_6]|nr:hypothetical protein [Microcoleus sp. SU_5_6]